MIVEPLIISIKMILSSIILGFARAFGEFGAALMVACNIPGKAQSIISIENISL